MISPYSTGVTSVFLPFFTIINLFILYTPIITYFFTAFIVIMLFFVTKNCVYFFFSATIKKYPNQQNRLYKCLYINVREPCFIEHTRTVPEPVAEPFFSFFSGSLFGSGLVRVFSFLKMIKSLLYQRFQHVVRVVRFFFSC